ncbi:hypothetical protein EBX93_09710 [bacterium]|nr:hypothetical protein [bacterium]
MYKGTLATLFSKFCAANKTRSSLFVFPTRLTLGIHGIDFKQVNWVDISVKMGNRGRLFFTHMQFALCFLSIIPTLCPPK